MFVLMLILMIWYPLNKKKDAEMREKLGAMRLTYDLNEEKPAAMQSPSETPSGDNEN